MHFCKLESLMRAALLSLCLVVIAGCKVKNPNYCEDTDDHLCMQPDAKPMVCDESSDRHRRAEDLRDGRVRECTTAEDDACTGTKPFCDMNACRACKQHADCPDSNACLPDGSCAAPATSPMRAARDPELRAPRQPPAVT